MKKIILLIAICVHIISANGQNSCLNAMNIYGPQNSIPPVGTISPTGPDLGCLTVTERQMWYYIPVCKIANINYIHISATYNQLNNPNEKIGVVFYGPFNQKISNCSDLNASKILHCQESQAFYVNAVTNGDTLQEGSYYYILFTFTDSIPVQQVLPSVQILNSAFPCMECNNQVSVLHRKNFCSLSVDTAINKCHLTWEEFSDQNIMGYIVYRETALNNQFDSIATIPLGSSSEYVDMNSSPAQQSYAYKIEAVDSCGQINTWGVNNAQYTMHLLSFAGGNNQAQLIWNNIYQGGSTYIPQYYIYRNSNGSGWQVIDSVSTLFSPMSYTDIYAPAGTNNYVVGLVNTVACNPMRAMSSMGQNVFSNTTTTIVTGYEQLTNNSIISIYPNPAKGIFTIDLNYLNQRENQVFIFNMTGKKVLESKLTGEKLLQIESRNFAKGVYTILISGDKVYRNKLVIE